MTGSRGQSAAYVQVAAVLRAEIIAGQLPEGARFPSGPQITARFAISKTTAEQTFRLLESEGLIVTRPGVGSFITAAVPPAVTIAAGPGTVVTARFPRPGEASGVPPGVPVLEVTAPGAAAVLYAADRTVIVVAAPSGARKGPPGASGAAPP